MLRYENLCMLFSTQVAVYPAEISEWGMLDFIIGHFSYFRDTWNGTIFFLGTSFQCTQAIKTAMILGGLVRDYTAQPPA